MRLLGRYGVILGGLVFVVGVFGPGASVSAGKDLNNRLKGDYSTILSASCAVGPIGGFGSNLERVPVGGSIIPESTLNIELAGVFHYNGDGTGTFAHQRLRVLDDNVRPLIQAEGNCTVTYSVNPDGSFSQQLSCVSTLLKGIAGPNSPGQTLTEPGFRLNGIIGLPGKILLFSDTSPDTELVQFSGTTPLNLNRICGRSGTGVKTRSGGDDD